MNTAERAIALADALTQFPFLGRITAESLVALVRAELGHSAVLDDFQPHGRHLAKAEPAATILHILSGNTPSAALQSLLRGLLIGSHNLCKLPSAGLPEVARFQTSLPRELASRIETERDLPEEWLEDADAVIVFGSDETIAHFRGLVREDQTFLPHGHRLSCGVVFADPHFESVSGAARDASVFDQQGCLSPHVFYVADDPLAYAARLASEMQQFHAQEPRGALSLSEANSIRALRADLAFRAANDEPVVVFQSTGSTAWTVAFDAHPGFPRSPLNRFVFVKPLPADLRSALSAVRPHLSTAGIWPATLANARAAAETGVSRVCQIGRMQLPPLTWHQDGQPPLGRLVRWIDAELAEGEEGV